MDDAEKILLAIADPIPWVWQEPTPGCGHWQATGDRVQYHIYDGQVRDTAIDTLHSPCPWHLVVQHFLNEHDARLVPAASLEEAKRFALHHWLTRDLTAVVAVHADKVAAFEAARKAYEGQWQTARGNLVNRFLACHTPYLTADPPDREVAEFRMRGRRGTYHAHFDAQRRWIVKLARPDQMTEERCFLARAFVEMGCSYHSQMGQWRGTLKANQKSLWEYFAPSPISPVPAKVTNHAGDVRSEP